MSNLIDDMYHGRRPAEFVKAFGDVKPDDLYDGRPIDLTGEERSTLLGLCSASRLMMLQDLKRGMVPERVLNRYRADAAALGELLEELR